jgi:hypothetical protein
MQDISNWDWGTGEKAVADIAEIRSRYEEAREFAVSDDGEKIAVTVKGDEGVTPCVNGEPWNATFDKAWGLRFLPTGKLFALVMKDDEWTVGVDGETWEEKFDFAWNPRFTADGAGVMVQVKSGMDYTLAVNGKAWEKKFSSIRDFAISPNGQTVIAAVQIEPLKEGDTEKFLEGVWAVAVNDELLDGKFLNVWGPRSTDAGKTAAEVRTGIMEFSVMQDGTVWPDRYGMVWEPCLAPSGSVLVPVRLPGGWTLARDGKIVWTGRYVQLFRLRLSPDASRIAGVAAPSFGRWTVVVDDVPWPTTWDEAVLDPIFSPDGRRVAAAVRSNGQWSVAVDGKAWSATFDMAWDPVFSPGSDRVAARVEKDGALTLAIDGRLSPRRYEMCWNPVFSPDGKKLLIRAVEKGKYVRSVVSLEAF